MSNPYRPTGMHAGERPADKSEIYRLRAFSEIHRITAFIRRPQSLKAYYRRHNVTVISVRQPVTLVDRDDYRAYRNKNQAVRLLVSDFYCH